MYEICSLNMAEVFPGHNVYTTYLIQNSFGLISLNNKKLNKNTGANSI